jgi:hypothetical protein
LARFIEKLTKVDIAIDTLVSLALSPRRSYILEYDLQVHALATSSSGIPMTISLSDVQESWCRDGELPALLAQMKTRASGTSESDNTITVTSKIHSECDLVAWVASTVEELDIKLIPYMSCSKPHCFACFIWLEAVNDTACFPALQRIAFDGCHGGLSPGWMPPRVNAAAHEQLMSTLCMRVDKEFRLRKHPKDSSASSISYDLPIRSKHFTAEDVERILGIRRFFTLYIHTYSTDIIDLEAGEEE